MGPPSSVLRDFRSLYEKLAPDVFAAASAELADPDQALQIMHGTFCEIWWLLACYNDSLGERQVALWARDIARARAIERRTALGLIALDPEPGNNFWVDFLASQDTSAQAVFQKMLTSVDDPVPMPDSRRLVGNG